MTYRAVTVLVVLLTAFSLAACSTPRPPRAKCNGALVRINPEAETIAPSGDVSSEEKERALQ